MLSKEHMKEVCLAGQGEKCCKYITFGEGGFHCAKLSTLKHTIDAQTHMRAKGDNCDGVVNENV